MAHMGYHVLQRFTKETLWEFTHLKFEQTTHHTHHTDPPNTTLLPSHTHTQTHMYMHVYLCMCVYAYIYVNVYVHVHVYVYV